MNLSNLLPEQMDLLRQLAAITARVERASQIFHVAYTTSSLGSLSGGDLSDEMTVVLQDLQDLEDAGLLRSVNLNTAYVEFEVTQLGREAASP